MEILREISLVLNVTVVILGSVLKIPQIIELYKSKSSKGISIWGNFLDLICFITGLGYGYSLSYPIHAYAENIFLTIQEISLIYLAILYGKVTDMVTLTTFVLLVAFYLGTILSLVPVVVFQTLMAVILLVVVVGKVIQIRSVVLIKSAGSVSVISWAIGAYICITRVFTTLVLTPNDVQVMVNYTVGIPLHIIMLMLLFYYGHPEKKEQ